MGKKYLPEKKCNFLSFPILGGLNSTRALKSSPFQNPGGTLSATKDGRTEDILVSNIGLLLCTALYLTLL